MVCGVCDVCVVCGVCGARINLYVSFINSVCMCVCAFIQFSFFWTDYRNLSSARMNSLFYSFWMERVRDSEREAATLFDLILRRPSSGSRDHTEFLRSFFQKTHRSAHPGAEVPLHHPLTDKDTSRHTTKAQLCPLCHRYRGHSITPLPPSPAVKQTRTFDLAFPSAS